VEDEIGAEISHRRISVAIIVTVMALGTQLNETFDTVSGDLASVGQ
jgi:hypothetical protein